MNAGEHLLGKALLQRPTLGRYCLDESYLQQQLRAAGSSAGALRALLRHLLCSLEARMLEEDLPQEIRARVRNEACRIEAALDSEPDAFYSLDNDAFLKDLSILLLTLLPCGAELVQIRAGIPRSVVLRGGLRQFLRGLWFFGVRTHGFRPFLSLHMDVRFTEDFNPDGWHRTYLCIAELLRSRPELKGVFGTAWFYDPEIERISPHLSYLRVQREMAGARTFIYGPSESARRNALARSRTRRRLYEEGRYEPKSCYIVWPRRDLLRWAEANRGGSN